jgi:hypothetical protein
MDTFRNQLAVLHIQNTLGVLGYLHIVRDQQDRAPALVHPGK